MEKALTKVTSLKLGNSWITKKAKEEFSNITEDISVSKYFLGFTCILEYFLFPSFLLVNLCFFLHLVSLAAFVDVCAYNRGSAGYLGCVLFVPN